MSLRCVLFGHGEEGRRWPECSRRNVFILRWASSIQYRRMEQCSNYAIERQSEHCSIFLDTSLVKSIAFCCRPVVVSLELPTNYWYRGTPTSINHNKLMRQRNYRLKVSHTALYIFIKILSGDFGITISTLALPCAAPSGPARAASTHPSGSLGGRPMPCGLL